VKHWRRSISSTRGRLRGGVMARGWGGDDGGGGRRREAEEVLWEGAGRSSSMTICVGMGG